jgi:hypothetical protein
VVVCGCGERDWNVELVVRHMLEMGCGGRDLSVVARGQGRSDV